MAEEQKKMIEIKKGKYTLRGQEVDDIKCGGLGITKIGSGRSAEVYQGTSENGKVVALKRLVRPLSNMTNRDLESHAETLSPSKMKIKGIVTIDNYFTISEEFNGQRQDVVYYVTDFYEEGSLLKALSDKYTSNNEWYKQEPDIAQSYEFILNILNILSQVHAENKDHGDLRLQNLLLKEGKVNLNDFSFRKDTEASKLIDYSSDFEKLVKEAELNFVPKPYGGREAERSSSQRDIFMVSQAVALGLLTCWQGSRGNIPYFNNSIPKEIADIIDRGRAEDPSQRPTAVEFLEELEKAIEKCTPLRIIRDTDQYRRVLKLEDYFDQKAKAIVETAKNIWASLKTDSPFQRLHDEYTALSGQANVPEPTKKALSSLLEKYLPQLFQKALEEKKGKIAVSPQDLQEIKTLYQSCTTISPGANCREAIDQHFAASLEELFDKEMGRLQGQPDFDRPDIESIKPFLDEYGDATVVNPKIKKAAQERLRKTYFPGITTKLDRKNAEIQRTIAGDPNGQEEKLQVEQLVKQGKGLDKMVDDLVAQTDSSITEVLDKLKARQAQVEEIRKIYGIKEYLKTTFGYAWEPSPNTSKYQSDQFVAATTGKIKKLLEKVK